MLHPRTYEGRPLGGRAVYTALHGARLSSVPSGDQSPAGPPLQGTELAALSTPETSLERPSILTDYTYDSELDNADGVPHSVSTQRFFYSFL